MTAVPEYSNPAYWEDLVQRGPLVALDTARLVIADDAASGDARLLAIRTASRSLYELGRHAEAVAVGRTGLSGAPDASDQVRWATTMTVAFIMAEAGDVDVALEHLRRLALQSHGVARGRVRLQTALALLVAARTSEALVELDASAKLLVASNEPGDVWRVHHNRGYALLQLGQLDAADRDFEIAQRVATSNDMTLAASQTHANRGVLHGRYRRPLRSIEHFDAAARLFAECGEPRRMFAITEVDRAEAMMLLGLVADAVEAAARAVELVGDTGNVMAIGDARLVLARAQLAARRFGDAERTAADAADLFEQSGRSNLVPQARSVAARARLGTARTEEAVRSELTSSASLAPGLGSYDWHDQELEFRHERVCAAHRWSLWALVADDLSALSAGTGDGRANVLMRRFAQAVIHFRDGELEASVAAAISGLDQLDEIVTESPTLVERSAAISLGADLSHLVIQVALERGNADLLFAAAEGTRARALHDELHEQYRHRPLTSAGAQRLQREVAEQLGDRVLVEWIVSRGRIVAVVIDEHGPRLVDVADERDVRRACDRVVISLDMATTDPDASSDRALRAAQVLDHVLVAPLGLGDATGVVVVPVGKLHEIPWAGLPSLATRSVSLAPSAQMWLGADRRSADPPDRVAILSGPDVDGAFLDREAVVHHYPGAAVVEDEAATAAAARSLFAEGGLVHVAAHGRFRSDRPLLSTLRLHDGEATLYDAVPERVGARLIVLSSCEGGAQGTADGSEVLGLSAVMLARGAATVVAPLTVVRDLECAEFVAEVHAELAAGRPVGRALADVRSRWLGDDDLSRWAVASSFLCFGSAATHVQVVSDTT